MDKYIVVVKVKGKIHNTYQYHAYSYLKARPYEIDEVLESNNRLLPEPEKNKSYIVCNIITSWVVDYKPFKNGWEVQTENSLYRFFVSDMNEINNLVKENNFKVSKKMGEALYWS